MYWSHSAHHRQDILLSMTSIQFDF
jgi:hypothetical protein